MKAIIKVSIVFMVLSGSVFTKVNSQATNCNVTVQFTTVSKAVSFAPKNVLAVWVGSGTNQFVRTLKVMANQRKQYLYTWNDESGGNTVDAITGATKTEHSAETIVWDGKDASQVLVPDGDYNIIVEFTEEHAQGPVLIIPFVKKTTNSDSTYNNEANFTNISINYEVNLTPVNEIMAKTEEFAVYPNPITDGSKIKINVDKNTLAHLSIYSLNGQRLIDMGFVNLAGGDNFLELNRKTVNELPTGTYLLRLEYNNEIKVVKLVKQ
jgi:hypothetical protein